MVEIICDAVFDVVTIWQYTKLKITLVIVHYISEKY
jgi:hypothetical protein